MSSHAPMNLGRAPARRDWRLPRSQRGNLGRLAMFLVASALLGHLQARQPARRISMKEGVSAAALPLIAALSTAVNSIHDAAAVLPRSRQIAAENRSLRNQVAELRRRNSALVEDALEKERLRALLQLRSNIPYRCTAAGVIGRQLSQWPIAIILDRGRTDGIRPRQPVVAAAGLVGRVYSVSAHGAVVIPITDRNSSAGALVQRSRSAGILEGDGETCRLNYLPLQADARPGDAVVSSGLGGIFPRGIVIGTIVSVGRDDTAAVKSALVRPNVDLSRVEEVLVINR